MAGDRDGVSVVMPTFDRAGVLGPAIACVLASPEAAELVVVDDGSTDGTGSVVGAIRDDRVRYHRQENRGLCAARNAGLALARQPWVAFVDDDDLWAPDKLARQLEALAAAPSARWCVTSVVVADEHLNPVLVQRAPPADQVGPGLRRGNCVPGGGSGVLVERDLLVALGGFDTSLRHLGDWELWLRLSAVGPPAVVDEPQLVYRRHRAQMSVDLAAIAAEVGELARRGLVDPDARAATVGGGRAGATSPDPVTARRLGRVLLARQGRAAAEAAAALVAEVRRTAGA